MESFQDLSRSILDGNAEMASELTLRLVAAEIPADEILTRGIIPGIQQVGELFEAGEYFLPELLMGGEATTVALGILEPLLAASVGHTRGRLLIGTVRNDVHDIGKSIVIMMFKGNGWQVSDLGVDVPPEEFVRAVREGDFDVLGLSSLLTITMPSVVETIESLCKAGLRDKVKIMVGGAPVTRQWVESIGADAYAADAPAAVNVAATLIRKDGVR